MVPTGTVKPAQESVLRLDGHSAQVVHLAFHHHGNFLATRSHDGTTRTWDVNGGRQLLRVTRGFQYFSRDGSRLARAEAAI